MKIFNLIRRNTILILTRFWYARNKKREKNLWVFGEWFGKRCCDNCFYFANYIADSHSDIDLVWISMNGVDISRLNDKIKTCTMDTTEANNYLRRAGVVFIVQGSEDLIHSNKCYYGGALVVNFWHGVPWKRIHFDTYKSWILLYQKMRTKLYGGQVYLAISEDFRQILHSAFFCKNSQIICSGYPRNSIFYDSIYLEEAKMKFMNHLRSFGVSIENSTKIITYMPTFRDKNENVFSFESITTSISLNEILERHDAIIIQKLHFISSQRSPYSPYRNNRIFLINDYPSQELLAATDILITDYSSCFFDYLILDRPIIHYLYDYDYYANDDRGLYYEKEDIVGGDIAETEAELVNLIGENLGDPKKCEVLRQQRKKRFMQYESINSCEQIYSDIIKRIAGKTNLC